MGIFIRTIRSLTLREWLTWRHQVSTVTHPTVTYYVKTRDGIGGTRSSQAEDEKYIEHCSWENFEERRKHIGYQDADGKDDINVNPKKQAHSVGVCTG